MHVSSILSFKPLSLMNSSRLLIFMFFCLSSINLLSVTKILSFQTSVTTSNVVSSVPISIESNESIEIITTKIEYRSSSYTSQPLISLQLQNTDGNWIAILGKENLKSDQSITLQGPCSLRISGNSHANYYWVKMNVFYNINPKEKEVPSKKFATVIPENATTNVRVILEQSTDLINWTAASPGVFPPSTAKRFFRVRSEEE